MTIIAGASHWSFGREEGVRILRVRRSARKGTFSAERRFGLEVIPFLMGGRFDVVHALGPRDAAGALLARKAARFRAVYTCLGIPVAGLDGRPDVDAHQRVVDEIDVYGCLSRYAMDSLQRDFGRRGALTPGGVRLDRFRPAKRDEVPTLLYSGALDEPRKRIAVLLEAIAIVAKTEPGVRLLLSGSGDPTKVLAAAPKDARERTDWLGVGELQELPQRYASAWATVLPSTDEAFGLVLIESLAAGTPIVVSNHAALPELVQPGIGVASTNNDPVALAQACLEVIELARDPSTPEHCREAALRYDWDSAVAPEVEALYLGSERDSALEM